MIDFITAELSAEGWLKGTTGLEIYSYRPNRGHSELFETALVAAGATVVDATDILRDVRRIKSPREREYLREAGRIADIGMAAARDALRVGATELEIHGAMTCRDPASGDVGHQDRITPRRAITQENPGR